MFFLILHLLNLILFELILSLRVFYHFEKIYPIQLFYLSYLGSHLTYHIPLLKKFLLIFLGSKLVLDLIFFLLIYIYSLLGYVQILLYLKVLYHIENQVCHQSILVVPVLQQLDHF